jgi:predicted DNA-binding transcriptional regulator AlpA
MPIKKFELAEAKASGRKRHSVADAADYVGLSESTLNKLRMTGAGPRFLKLGRRILYDTSALDDWMGARERVSTSDNGSSKEAA